MVRRLVLAALVPVGVGATQPLGEGGGRAARGRCASPGRAASARPGSPRTCRPARSGAARAPRPSGRARAAAGSAARVSGRISASRARQRAGREIVVRPGRHCSRRRAGSGVSAASSASARSAQPIHPGELVGIAGLAAGIAVRQIEPADHDAAAPRSRHSAPGRRPRAGRAGRAAAPRTAWRARTATPL